MKVDTSSIIVSAKHNCRDKVRKYIAGKHPVVIAIQGMPASGKTTFLNNVSEFLTQNHIPHSVIHSDNYIKDFSELMSQDKTYRVGILDIFKQNNMFVNSKSKPDKPHGFMVKNIITSSTPNVEILEHEIKAKKMGDKLTFDTKSVLKKLKQARQEKLDYLNLSVLFMHDYSVAGKSFTPDELHYPHIVSKLMEYMPKSVLNIIREIEAIASEGTQVYISSGNKKNQFNLLSLAKGTYTAGGMDKKTQMPVEYFTDNSLVSQYVELPFIFTNKNSKKFGLYLDLAKLSKRELKKRIATEKDYELLQNTIDKSKYESDVMTIQYQIPFLLPISQRKKIYDLKKLARIYNIDISENFHNIENVTHSDISMRQFFNMNSKGERHVISPRKTHNFRYCISGTSFAPPQAISEDIKLNEIARKEVIKNYNLYSKLIEYSQI
ncbi:hypothetical protein IKP85_05830 [bacterium]|nr:hypothetical protein [bacterium]